MIAEQEALPCLPHPGEVPGPFVHDFFTTALRHFYADPDGHPHLARAMAGAPGIRKAGF
jgi:hypothetical protein